MKRTPVICSLLAALFLCGTAASAQSLTDIAKKEEARRKAVKPSGKTYTNNDLKQYTPPAPPVQPAAPEAGQLPGDAAKPAPDAAKPAEGQPAPDAAKPAEGGEQKDEAYWRGLLEAAQTKLERDQSYMVALQSRINALTNDFYARDDPSQRTSLWAQRTKALDEVERLKKEVVDDTAAIAKIREDARRAGAPPGWLR